jgi:hypothetical protein
VSLNEKDMDNTHDKATYIHPHIVDAVHYLDNIDSPLGWTASTMYGHSFTVKIFKKC